MRNTTEKSKYRSAPKVIADAIDSSEIVEDFLPNPQDLVFKKKTVKVTMNLSKDSVEFFKRRSKQYGVPYQKMINNLVDKYVERFGQN
jgi:predicted DNA binding CopG/RHH family protein